MLFPFENSFGAGSVISLFEDARHRILSLMNNEISKPRDNKKPNHPIMKTIEIPVTQRGKFVGTGGVNLKRIQAKTDVQITPVEENKFSVFAPNQVALDEAEEMIKKLAEQPVSIRDND